MRFLVVGALVALTASAAHAQRDRIDLPIPGTQELSFSPLRLQLKPSVKTSSERLTYGRYTSPSFQYGLEFDRRQGRTFGIFANQSLRADETTRDRAFIGGFLGASQGRTVYGLQGGLKQFYGMSFGTVALVPQLIYRHTARSGAKERIALELGVSLFWR
jgi:hypothetical protein